MKNSQLQVSSEYSYKYVKKQLKIDTDSKKFHDKNEVRCIKSKIRFIKSAKSSPIKNKELNKFSSRTVNFIANYA